VFLDATYYKACARSVAVIVGETTCGPVQKMDTVAGIPLPKFVRYVDDRVSAYSLGSCRSHS
jgi:hypothetical protein